MSNSEQVGNVVRYVKSSIPVEKPLEYVKYKDIKGNPIVELILESGSDPLQSQTYNGNTASKINRKSKSDLLLLSSQKLN